MYIYICFFFRDVNERNTVKGYVKHFVQYFTVFVCLKVLSLLSISALCCLDLESSTFWAHIRK